MLRLLFYLKLEHVETTGQSDALERHFVAVTTRHRQSWSKIIRTELEQCFWPTAEMSVLYKKSSRNDSFMYSTLFQMSTCIVSTSGGFVSHGAPSWHWENALSYSWAWQSTWCDELVLLGLWTLLPHFHDGNCFQAQNRNNDLKSFIRNHDGQRTAPCNHGYSYLLSSLCTCTESVFIPDIKPKACMTLSVRPVETHTVWVTLS